MLFFSIYDKNNEVIADETVSEQWRVTTQARYYKEGWTV